MPEQQQPNIEGGMNEGDLSESLASRNAIACGKLVRELSSTRAGWWVGVSRNLAVVSRTQELVLSTFARLGHPTVDIASCPIPHPSTNPARQ